MMDSFEQSDENKFLPEYDENNPEQYFQRKIAPNTEAMAEKLKNAIQEDHDISRSFLNNFNHKLFKTNFQMLPDSLKLFEKLEIK